MSGFEPDGVLEVVCYKDDTDKRREDESLVEILASMSHDSLSAWWDWPYIVFMIALVSRALDVILEVIGKKKRIFIIKDNWKSNKR